MVRLEGLVIGGAVGSHEACFLDYLRQLKDPILEQIYDRRSAVARQAAHLMEVLAAALGVRFEPYAVTFMGALFKALVITVQVCYCAAAAASDATACSAFHTQCPAVGATATGDTGSACCSLLCAMYDPFSSPPLVHCVSGSNVCLWSCHALVSVYCNPCCCVQVVSEAADSAAKGILHHCHAPKLVPCVCDIMTADKSAKLRKHCSVLLLQVCAQLDTDPLISLNLCHGLSWVCCAHH
eukprot:GHUV01040644.1.p1 GENE.GHUV01040644.1~~GHUV01040644.1.p1  ORF type:complete len:239 (-),score=67.66 GHUV01040644.1:296-1012(-)